MPPVEETGLDRQAVLWRRVGQTAGNETLLGDPESVWVDWLETRREATAPDGTTIALDAQVRMVEDVPVGSQMWLAPDIAEDALHQWEALDDDEPRDVMEVRTKQSAPDVNTRVFSYKYGLARYRDRPA